MRYQEKSLMKQANFRFLFILFFLSITLCQQNKCDNHPAFGKITNILKNIIGNNNKQAIDALDRFAKDFKNSSPVKVDDDVLGVCSQFQGQESCCNKKKMTDFLDKMALFKVEQIQKQNNIAVKLFNALFHQIIKCDCQMKPNIQKPEQIDNLKQNINLKQLQTLINNLSKCNTQFQTTATQFLRGALCSVCSGVDNISNYFDNTKSLLINQESATKYQSQIDSSIDCFSNLVTLKGKNENPGLVSIIEEIFDYYFQDKTCYNKVVQKILSVFQNNGVSTTKPGTKEKVCCPQIVYKIQNECDQVIQGDSEIDSLLNKRLLRSNPNSKQNLNRILQQNFIQNTDASIVAVGGVNILVTSQLDQQIKGTGNITDITTDYDSNSNKIYQFSLILMILLQILF
ncbi:hypothetical protein ABPG74_016613 [Tetrahymena malaccensis]